MADILIKNVRLSFPTLGQPKEFKVGDGKPRWSATFLVEPGSEADQKIRAAIEEAAKEEWPKDWQQKLKALAGQKNQYCYLDGDTKSFDGYAGMWALSSHRAAKTKNGANTPPLIVDKDPKVSLRDERTGELIGGKPYAGCYVNAKVSIYAQGGENAGIRSSFSVIQFAADGDAFSSSTPTADDLEDLSVADEVDIC